MNPNEAKLCFDSAGSFVIRHRESTRGQKTGFPGHVNVGGGSASPRDSHSTELETQDIRPTHWTRVPEAA